MVLVKSRRLDWIDVAFVGCLTVIVAVLGSIEPVVMEMMLP